MQKRNFLWSNENMKKIYIAGAHSRAQTLRVYLEYLYPEVKVESYLVDSWKGNESIIDGVPVNLIQKGLNIEYPVYIATRRENHPKLIAELKDIGMKEIIPVTVELDIRLRNEYIRRIYQKQGRAFKLIDDLNIKDNSIGNIENIAKIYVASSIYDKPLKMKFQLTKDEIMIQVGTELTDKRIGDDVLMDNIGDNISNKNRQYCELTGLYWIWKHALEDYIGLVHYRRHFILPNNWIERMVQNDVDVLLPVPLYVAPNIEDNFKSRHLAEDWDCMISYFKRKLPDEYQKVKKVFDKNLYYPCNMFIMKRQVLHELCNWLFPIIDFVVKHGGEKEDLYMNRYPGFLSERLITYFFETHKDKYNIVYANKNFLI